MVGSGVSLDWGWVVWLVVGLTLVLDISNVARVGIGNIVGDDLGAAIGKGNTVRSSGGISITGLGLAEVGTRVLVSDTVLVSVDSWALIGWLLVAVDGLGWVVGSGGRSISWDHRLVDNWGWVVWSGSRLVNGLVDNWGGVVDWSWGVVRSGLVVNWSWVVDWGGVVWAGLVDWHVGWSMHSGAVLLSGVWVVHVLGGGMGLLGNHSAVRAVGLVDRVAHSGGIAVLDDLVVGLVSGGSGQEGRDSDKSLHVDVDGFGIS